MGLANTLCPRPFIQSLLLCEWAQCSEVRVPLESLRTSLKKEKKTFHKGCYALLILKWRHDIKTQAHLLCESGAVCLFLFVLISFPLLFNLRRRNSHARQGPEDTYFSSSGGQNKKIKEKYFSSSLCTCLYLVTYLLTYLLSYVFI